MDLIQRQVQACWQLRVFFNEDVFNPANPVLKDALADASQRKVLMVLEDSLAQASPGLESRIERYFSAHARRLQLVRPPLFVCGGERAKNSPTLVTDILSQIDRHHIDRHSYLIAVGGGALLDVAGFAAATAHRGLRLVRIPTTTLSQADSGIGVKNGINAFGKKNFIGTFAPPHAVINDFSLLATLEPRDKRAGYVEAVKVACIRDRAFFEEIAHEAGKLAAFEPAAMKRLIHRCAELHLDHIATSGDPFESGSARPLDFGHWSAHKLEQLSDFHQHGEAVAIGIALDVIYARKLVCWTRNPPDARADTAHAGPGHRRGVLRGHAWSQRLADLLEGDAAEHPLGAPLRRHPLQRAGDGGICAVSVVSGHIRGETNTMPLHVEILYNEYNIVGAFAVASLLALLALATLVLKSIVEWRSNTVTES